MQSIGKYHDRAYNFSFRIVKMSGYAFYSVRETDGGNVNFYRAQLDYFTFPISFLFSLFTVFGGVAKSFELNLKSAILDAGMMSFFQIFIIGTVMAKVNSFLHAQNSFKILFTFKWIDRMVQISWKHQTCQN